MLNLVYCLVLAAVLTPSEARGGQTTEKPKPTTTRSSIFDKFFPRRHVCDPLQEAQRQPKCNFPAVRVPTVSYQREAYRKFCSTLASLAEKNNGRLKPAAPFLCICTRYGIFAEMLSTCSTGSFFYNGQALGLQFWMLNAVSSLEMGNTLQKELAMGLVTALGTKFFRNLNTTRDNARNRICDCLPKIKSYYRSLSLKSKARLGKCVILTGIMGSKPRKALTLADAVNKPKDQNVMNLEAQLCPAKGCCVIQGTYVRNFTVCNRTFIEKNRYGSFVPLPKNICQRINMTIQGEITTCGGKAGITISKSRMAEFKMGDAGCNSFRQRTSSLANLADRIRNFTAGMCDSANITDKSCIKDFIQRIGIFKLVKGIREANITSSDDSDWESSRNASAPATIVRNKGKFLIGRLRAIKGKLQVETTDSSSESSVDYVETDGSTSRLSSKLKKMIVKQRMDLNGGSIDTTTNGEIQVDGVFTAKGGVNFTATRLRLVNAAVFRNRLTLKLGSKIQCEGALLLDGTEVDGPKTGKDFSLNCDATTASIISGRGKTNIIRVKTRSVKIEVNNGSLTLEADSTVTTLVTTPGGVLKIQKSSTVEVGDVDGDGDLDVQYNSTLQIVKRMRGKLTLRRGARLKIGKPVNTSTNETSPETTPIDADVNVTDTSKITFEGRQCRALKKFILGKLAKMVFKMRYGDKLGGNDTEPLVAGGTFQSMMEKNDSIEVDIDRKKFCQLKKRLYLIRMNNATNVKLPKRVRVILSGVAANCTKRRLQTQECATVIQNGQFIVDCTGSTAATTAPPKTGGTTATGSPGTTKKNPTDAAAHITSKLVFFFAAVLASFMV